MAEQYAVRMQRTLGLAGGAGGVDDDRRVVRRGVGRLERRRLIREFRREIAAARSKAVDAEHMLEIGQMAADLSKLCGAVAVGDRDLCRGIGQPVLQRLRPEQGEQRHRNGAHLVGSDVRDGGLRRLRQQDRDAVTMRDPHLPIEISKPVRPVPQRAIAVVARPVVRSHESEGDAVRLARGPAVAHVDPDVVALRYPPAEFTGERGVAVGRGQHGSIGIFRPPKW
jgi:hypothetical protein